MPCDRCRHLPERLPIDLPADMKRVADLARAAVASGALEDITRFDDGHPFHRRMAFAELPGNGPWPDVVGFDFRCTGCGGRFRFGADAYHGGGEWSRMTRPR